jgi:hypothetical protein
MERMKVQKMQTSVLLVLWVPMHQTKLWSSAFNVLEVHILMILDKKHVPNVNLELS